MLSGLSVQDLREAIFNESVQDLTQVRGIGRKIAERIVVELKDKIRSLTLSGAGTSQAASDGGPLPASAMEEATLALIALGIAAPAARTKAGYYSGAVDSVTRYICCSPDSSALARKSVRLSNRSFSLSRSRAESRTVTCSMRRLRFGPTRRSARASSARSKDLWANRSSDPQPFAIPLRNRG